MKLTQTLFLLTGGLAAATLHAADCSRTDIDHYLDRGFSHEQVLELCRQAPAPEGQHAQQASPDAAYWSEVIDAESVSLDRERLSFSRQQCIAYDRPNYAEQRKKACGVGHYSVSLKGLQVLSTKRKMLFWGGNAVLVDSANAERHFAYAQDTVSVRERELIEAEFLASDFAVPVRDGVAVDVVKHRLQALAQ